MGGGRRVRGRGDSLSWSTNLPICGCAGVRGERNVRIRRFGDTETRRHGDTEGQGDLAPVRGLAARRRRPQQRLLLPCARRRRSLLETRSPRRVPPSRAPPLRPAPSSFLRAIAASRRRTRAVDHSSGPNLVRLGRAAAAAAVVAGLGRYRGPRRLAGPIRLPPPARPRTAARPSAHQRGNARRPVQGTWQRTRQG